MLTQFKDFNLLPLHGDEARAYVNEIARLRIEVFREFPYLYEGSLEYEKKYLETYFHSSESLILLAFHQNQCIGATTGMRLTQADSLFQKPFQDKRIDPENVFYFGESVLDQKFRGFGLGRVFFQEREKFAKKIQRIRCLSFCRVVREKNHPMSPASYRPLDAFWTSEGFAPDLKMKTFFEWTDLGQPNPTKKEMEFWVKNIRSFD